MNQQNEGDYVLSKDDNRYNILIEYASDGIVSINKNGKIIEFNRKAEEIFQYTKEEIIGKNISTIIPKKLLFTHKKGVEKLIKNKKLMRAGELFEFFGVRKDGTQFPHEISFSVFKIKNDYIFTAIIRDISDRKQTEEKIKRQNEELILLNSIAQIIGQSIDLREILTTALGFVMDTSKAAIGAIFLPKNSKLSLEAYRNLMKKKLNKKQIYEINLEDNIVGYSARKGEIVISNNTHNKKHKIPEILAHPSKIKSFICLPLKSKEKVVGVLFVGYHYIFRFKEQYHELLKSIGSTVGVSIENARLFDEIKTKTIEIEQEKEKLKKLAKKLIISQEEERRKISRELHDEAGQLMSTLKINLEMIERNLPKKLTNISNLVRKSTKLVDQSSWEIKRLCTNLHPSVLDSLGLQAALSSYIYDFQMSRGVKSEFNYCEMKKRLPLEIEKIIYRVVQESLNNIAKHARASKLSVKLLDTPMSIIVAIEDDGVGFDVKKTISSQEDNKGLGLLGIKERVSLVKGKLTIKSKIGKGTAIRLEIPKKL